MNTPHLGNKACSLCTDRSIPQNLNAHVSVSQTCADVHLQLALLRYDNAMCSVGQEQYQEICCPKKRSGHVLKSTVGFLAGLFIVGYLIKRLSSKGNDSRANRSIESNASSNRGKVLPMTHENSSSSRSGKSNSSGSSRSKGSSDLEMPTTAYHNMDIVPTIMARSTIQKSRSQSRSRPQSRSRSRGRHDVRSASRPRAQSRSRSRALRASPSHTDSNKRSSSRVRSNSRQRSVSRGKGSRNRSRSRSKSRDRRRHQPHSASSNREEFERTYENPGYVNPGYVVEFNVNPYQRHDEVEVSSNIGPIAPTQLV
ncbi:hypothetical protein IV203_031766 [Nitzschia inconspicua]|uniref:Uncharacterized protein n=1 Tax=Nitzschia inconspicua TaxID=303405 RepID=A0A9K3LUX0_9STRA|nr:hypothetical protein IV203_031766 [Nitzschia inconspicua]